MGPPPIRTRSRSRETRAASLEKLNQPGSIKINKSLCLDKRSRDSVANKSASRQGSREVEGESSSWTDSEDDIDKRKEGGIHVIGKRKVLIAKVEKTVVIQPRQGKWIPVSVENLNRKNKDDFESSLDDHERLNVILEPQGKVCRVHMEQEVWRTFRQHTKEEIRSGSVDSEGKSILFYVDFCL